MTRRFSILFAAAVLVALTCQATPFDVQIATSAMGGGGNVGALEFKLMVGASTVLPVSAFVYDFDAGTLAAINPAGYDGESGFNTTGDIASGVTLLNGDGGFTDYLVYLTWPSPTVNFLMDLTGTSPGMVFAVYVLDADLAPIQGYSAFTDESDPYYGISALFVVGDTGDVTVTDFRDAVTVTTPEPAAFALVGASLLLAAGWRARRRRL